MTDTSLPPDDDQSASTGAPADAEATTTDEATTDDAGTADAEEVQP